MKRKIDLDVLKIGDVLYQNNGEKMEVVNFSDYEITCENLANGGTYVYNTNGELISGKRPQDINVNAVVCEEDFEDENDEEEDDDDEDDNEEIMAQIIKLFDFAQNVQKCMPLIKDFINKQNNK